MTHLKKLTMPDLARRIADDHALKKRLVDAVVPLMPDERTPELEQRVLKAIDDSLVQAAGTGERKTYHITCASCDLNHVLETQNWRSAGLRIECCTCGAVGTIRMPEGDAVVVCKTCGAETRIQKVGTEV